MNKLKQMLKPVETRYTPAERFTLRVEDGVEIFEHEAVYMQRIPKPDGTPFREKVSPRLTVIESGQETGQVLTKTRSEISGLQALLHALVTT